MENEQGTVSGKKGSNDGKKRKMTERRKRKGSVCRFLSSLTPSVGVKSVEMWRRWECGLCYAREKVEQESKLGDFEIQSIKLLAFRRAVAGVVRLFSTP